MQSDDVDTILVRVTVDFNPDLEGYDPAEDADLDEEFLTKSEGRSASLFRKIWTEQCEAAEGIEAKHATEKALGYLIGEKLRADARDLMPFLFAINLTVVGWGGRYARPAEC